MLSHWSAVILGPPQSCSPARTKYPESPWTEPRTEESPRMVTLLRVQVTKEAVQLPTSQDMKSKMTWTSEELDSDSMLSKGPNGIIVCV